MLKINHKKKFLLCFVDVFGKLLLGWNCRKNKVDKAKLKKILVMELWGLGDIVLATPALISLRRKFPDSEIYLLAKGHAEDVLKNGPLINKFIKYDFPWTGFFGKYKLWDWDIKGLFRIIYNLRKERFDIALDARMDFRNNLLSFLTRAKRRVGYDFTGGGYFLTDVVPKSKSGHRVDEWANLLRYLDINIQDVRPRISVSAEEDKWADGFFSNNGIRDENLIVGIHPGARIKKRCWSLDRFARVAEYVRDRHNARIIIFVEPDGYGEDISIRGDFIKVKVSLRELIALIKRLNLFICNDGGAMHISTAVDTPVVAIFGPGDLEAIGPYGEGHKIVIKEGFPCRPCYDYCKYREPYCLTEITVEDVIKVVDEKLNQKVELSANGQYRK